VSHAAAATPVQLWATFTAKAQALGTTVLHAESEAHLAQLLSEAGQVAVTASAARRYASLASGFESAADGPSVEVAAAAEFAVAETGSLVLDEPRADRGACFLADRLWLLVPLDALVATIDEAFLRLADLIRAGAKHPLLMSGPSRTADIERVLTVGVHGPRSLVAVIVDSAGPRPPSGALDSSIR